MFAKRMRSGALEGWGEDVFVDLQISWFLSEITCHAHHDYLVNTLHPTDDEILRVLTIIVCFWHLRPKFEVQSMHTS